MNFEFEEWRVLRPGQNLIEFYDATDFQEIPFPFPPFNITSSVPGTDINPDNYQGLMLESVVNGSLSLTCDCVTVNRSLWATVGG